VIGHILKGWLFWQRVRIKYLINYNKTLIVLSDENYELDRQVLLHLPDYVERKHADKAIVLCDESRLHEWSYILPKNINMQIKAMSKEDMEKLYDYYCFFKFFDNVVFTYTDKPKDNLLGKFLRETDVNEEDAAFLALYHLRSIPKTKG
jgi:hypothetical protein